MKIHYLKLRFAAALLPAVIVSGCFEQNFEEDHGLLSVSSMEMVIPSDDPSGQNMLKDTLFVTANRSWDVAFVEDADWVSIDTVGHQDIARITEMTPLILSFKDNETEQDRSVTLKIFSAAGEKNVTIRQKAISYRLQLVSVSKDTKGIKCDGDTLKIKINSNTSWSVKARDDSQSKLKFVDDSGQYSGSVQVIIPENEDLMNKGSVIVISAKGCKDIEIPISQLPGYPYFKVLSDTLAIAAVDGVDNCKVNIKTNSNWNATILSSEGFTGKIGFEYTDPMTGIKDTLLTTSGTKKSTSVTILYPYTTDFLGKGKITVRFTGEGVAEPVTATIEQNPCIRMSFGALSKDSMWKAGVSIGISLSDEYWPFSLPVWKDVPSSKGSAVFKRTKTNPEHEFVLKNGYSFIASSVNGFWKNGTTGFMLGGAIGDYLKLPVVEGRKLTAIYYTFRGTSAFMGSITGPDDTPLTDGDFTTGGQGSQTEILPKGAEPGVQYKISAKNTAIFQIGDLLLYYE